MKSRKIIVLAVAFCAILLGITAYSAVSNILAVGTIPHSELFDGPATVTVRQFIIAPGETLQWHYHPGRAYNVIKRGTLTVEEGCGQVETFAAGGAFEETEFHVHRAMNLGTEEVEVYNTFIISAGNPTTVNIPNNERRCGPLVPVLSLSTVKFCPGGSWTLSATNGVPNTTVHLIGTSNGRAWRVSDWGKTDGNGVLSVGGVFAAGTEGEHRLRFDIGGLPSNAVSFTVSKCTP
ncbi:MAG TPA: cupin domain-containing protein [Terriglobia bacterium]|nr:cupin domain-containing protein [Terriglobia bacterium]